MEPNDNPNITDTINEQTTETSVDQSDQSIKVDNKPKKFKKSLKIIIAIAIPLLVAGIVFAVLCITNKKAATPNIPPKVASNLPSGEGQQYLAEANSQFAFDLYNKLDESENNLFYSPYSISSALAMVYEGVKGETANQIKDVFYFPETAKLRTGYQQMYQDINKTDKEYELNTGNAIWPATNFNIKSDYVNVIKDSYGGVVYPLDYSQTKESADTINNYISKQTKDKINNLISEDAIDPIATKIILTNAIYFKADWLYQFTKEDTDENADFNVSNDQTVKVSLMNAYDLSNLKYLKTDKMQLIELPYKGEEISMLIMLPKTDLNSIKGSLNLDQYKDLTSRMTKKEITRLAIPKFKFETDYELNQPLIDLGMPLAFDGQADFTGMFTPINNEKLHISLVKHKAYIQVDELGTEAAAATAVIVDGSVADPEASTNFIADHPFIFIIKNNVTNNILFIGKVYDPSK